LANDLIKHLNVCQKYCAVLHVFNSLIVLWKCGELGESVITLTGKRIVGFNWFIKAVSVDYHFPKRFFNLIANQRVVFKVLSVTVITLGMHTRSSGPETMLIKQAGKNMLRTKKSD